ncbi:MULTISPECIES: phosphonate metabolism protein/1,5-bisphosphokinase (PRPP-forming) PhnN [unclassified Variovorax]|uniref:phosphonate metabolism protein/1,5-bisphosphokinase (PRPP-forming) PhnN n=1 Tax=unclassified Variovorax TaxID=663243 RepID=UPI002B23B54D|nr:MULTISPECIES: phosphonate metabolism protein/1,5-bisphosphokinase (PRPP-forming) PhnN [unclassified Variovorax]MEB0059991.1 phosphonate metabolism protein/1,5-bisphosphokinase (PRPP-forming) PhnN [Variovorax sp. LG9.2]MEB0112628.1 phosphonate metabolism protein/1,5-bisphosphokinase (PRPP-forming) PhnN [Variovorax sp. RTB1]
MKGQLIYVMGPSGAGKDSLLAWLRNHLPLEASVHWARRTITRPVQSGDEQHHSVDAQAFQRLCEAQAFAFDWQANGLRYGVRHVELAPLDAGCRVIVNGSRAYLSQALIRFPELEVIHVTASVDTLRARLLARGRETPAAVEARIERALAFQAPAGAIEVYNDGSLEDAGLQFLRAFHRG